MHPVANVYSSVFKYVLRVVSRLQGDSLSDSRSEEERRTRVSEQAVPDISCKLHDRVQIRFLIFLSVSTILWSHALLCPSFPPCFCVLFGAAQLPGLDTVAARLQECEASSQVSGSVSVLPRSITKQL